MPKRKVEVISNVIGLPNYVFGHSIDMIDGVWRYRDTGEPVAYHTNGVGPLVPAERACPACKRSQTAAGHDPCIANLPGVWAACCGHGVESGYVAFDNGVRIGGMFNVSRHDR